jgi:galactokinase
LEKFEKNIIDLYENSQSEIDYQKKRYSRLMQMYFDTFQEDDNLYIISTPGRTELSGNHTDHNGGKVIAASINLDSIAVFSKSDKNVILKSDIYDQPFKVDINSLEYREDEKETTSALIRGIAKGFIMRGYHVGSFNGVLSSNVIQGSGLSSSASIEVLIGSIFNYLYNDNLIPPAEIAKIGQFAENNYFGKPCGLMDQIACATGGIVAIDFRDNINPITEKLNFDFERFGYKLLVLNTGGTHHNLTNDYAAIPIEMKKIAEYFGETNCSSIETEQILTHWEKLRNQYSDRAILRTMHFINENLRVSAQTEALKNNNMDRFLYFVNKSGDSSYKYLQNIYSVNNVEEQPLSLALAMTEEYIEKIGNGACRVHGGGFAGTIQVFIPMESVSEYIALMEKLFGRNSVSQLSIRPNGSVIKPVTTGEFKSII